MICYFLSLGMCSSLSVWLVSWVIWGWLTRGSPFPAPCVPPVHLLVEQCEKQETLSALFSNNYNVPILSTALSTNLEQHHPNYYKENEIYPRQNQGIGVQLVHRCFLKLYYLERIFAVLCIHFVYSSR